MTAPIYDFHKTPQLQQIAKEWRPFIEGKKFVWLVMPEWDGVWTRQNHFTLRLAELGADILYVEAPRSLTRVVSARRLPTSIKPRIRQVHEHIHVLTPPPALPGTMRSDLISNLTGRELGWCVSSFLREHGWTEYACWHRVPTNLFILPHLHPAPAFQCYDITDDYPLFYHGTAAEHVKRREQALLPLVNMVTTTGQEIVESRQQYNPNFYVVPNGVDYELFAQVGQASNKRNPAVADMQAPVIGYVGLVAGWIDLELVARIAQRWPGHCLFIGPFAGDLEAKARAIPGVRWTGFVDRPNLVGYLEAMDVCIIPFQTNGLTRAAKPLKFWEYMATGKPVVSIDIPMLDECRDLVEAARNHDEFIQGIERSLAPEAPERAAARRALAAQHSWDSLFVQMLTGLKRSLERAA